MGTARYQKMRRRLEREESHRPRESWGKGSRADEDCLRAEHPRQRKGEASGVKQASSYARRTQTGGGPLTLFYDAGKPVNRCLGAEETLLPYVSSIGAKLYAPDGDLGQVSSGKPLERPDGRWSWAALWPQLHEWRFPRGRERLARSKGQHTRHRPPRRLCRPARHCGGHCR